MQLDTLIIGAGAAGMMCAAHSGGRTLVIDHAKSAGEKIRISGGGRCNFTNMYAAPENFLSQNPHFCKSALSRYTQWDFIDLVARHNISYHEKTLGQLFCDTSAKDIIRMLLDEMTKAGADLWLQTSVTDIRKQDTGFKVDLETDGTRKTVNCQNLVIACGGKSIPKMGASGFGYQVARQFDLTMTDTRPALVPLTFGDDVLSDLKQLAGLSVPARVSCNGTSFDEGLLFTHRGLSGPSILQISSYWREKDAISIHLDPAQNIDTELKSRRTTSGRRNLSTTLADLLPARLAQHMIALSGLSGNLADQSDQTLSLLNKLLTNWQLTPIGSEGYRTAEVTLGGVSTNMLSSKTMEVKTVPGLYFIGEIVDVTGWLGGYNFQWAWSSGWAAGQATSSRLKQ
ncbi:NAD(P)/FAD-dependent oxidoreductase [Parasulfitobacter algicola]|uniref:NAD(P)/FAD-dependent oxidoreductase n=1 Tax=Parasulfitobacter algicola TaxID=2614809 RepID=A0ABX2IV86_9RHOB|nr:NAD(P)/FAD-dependent oxidoreductase [Sulfitobacter algicola]NSX54186.1 NAD(P)/FAD-dependent oxidoreductase [Sulfitobacter algicola]